MIEKQTHKKIQIFKNSTTYWKILLHTEILWNIATIFFTLWMIQTFVNASKLQISSLSNSLHNTTPYCLCCKVVTGSRVIPFLHALETISNLLLNPLAYLVVVYMWKHAFICDYATNKNQTLTVKLQKTCSLLQWCRLNLVINFSCR